MSGVLYAADRNPVNLFLRDPERAGRCARRHGFKFSRCSISNTALLFGSSDTGATGQQGRNAGQESVVQPPYDKENIMEEQIGSLLGSFIGIVIVAIFGLIVGALAKWIMPGKGPGGNLFHDAVGDRGFLYRRRNWAFDWSPR